MDLTKHFTNFSKYSKKNTKDSENLRTGKYSYFSWNYG